MKSKNMLYEAKEFKNLREIIQNSVEKYQYNNAFIIKNKQGSKEKYTEQYRL